MGTINFCMAEMFIGKHNCWIMALDTLEWPFFCHKFLTSGDRKSAVRKQPSDCGNT